MLVVVKKPHTKKPRLEMRGEIPAWIINGLKRDYGSALSIMDEDEEYVNIVETDWYKKMSAEMTPEVSMKTLRMKFRFTQAQLAEKLGVHVQNVSDMENGRRGISKETAKKLAHLFKVPVGRFI